MHPAQSLAAVLFTGNGAGGVLLAVLGQIQIAQNVQAVVHRHKNRVLASCKILAVVDGQLGGSAIIQAAAVEEHEHRLFTGQALGPDVQVLAGLVGHHVGQSARGAELLPVDLTGAVQAAVLRSHRAVSQSQPPAVGIGGDGLRALETLCRCIGNAEEAVHAIVQIADQLAGLDLHRGHLNGRSARQIDAVLLIHRCCGGSGFRRSGPCGHAHAGDQCSCTGQCRGLEEIAACHLFHD